MNKIFIKGAQIVHVTDDLRNGDKDVVAEGFDSMDASDGYHTFSDLYAHRIALFIALAGKIIVRDEEGEPNGVEVWRSKLHSDGTSFDGWFILGINKEAGKQITYHLPMEEWENTEFAETLDKAPEFDGHTPVDVVERLKKL